MMSISRLNCSCSWGRYSWSKPRRRDGLTFCTSDRLDGNLLPAVLLLHVAIDDRLKLLGDALAFDRHGLPAVDVDRLDRHFPGARQADPDGGVLLFARPVDDAAHHGDAHLLDAGIRRLPHRHLI